MGQDNSPPSEDMLMICPPLARSMGAAACEHRNVLFRLEFR